MVRIKRVCQICGRVEEIDIFEDPEKWVSFDLYDILKELRGREYRWWLGYDLHVCEKCKEDTCNDTYKKLLKVLRER